MSDVPLVPSGNRDMYEELAAAAPPANNGEPCRNCGTSIARTAHPVHRKRHVCSPRCNDLLKRRHKYAVNKARAAEPEPEIPGEDLLRVEPLLNARQREPRVFRTNPSAELRYEFTAGAPIEGDVVERDGAVTRYLLNDGIYVAYSDNTGSFLVLGSLLSANVNTADYWANLHHRAFLADGRKVSLLQEFEHDGISWVWSTEIIRDVTEDGRDITWRAVVCANQERSTLWAPAYVARSQRYDRTSKASASAAARARELGFDIVIDRVDPWDVHERDGWICQLCGAPVDRDLPWPHPRSVTLDHVQPISRGGSHIAVNLQTAHWECNMIKGATEPGSTR